MLIVMFPSRNHDAHKSENICTVIEKSQHFLSANHLPIVALQTLRSVTPPLSVEVVGPNALHLPATSLLRFGKWRKC